MVNRWSLHHPMLKIKIIQIMIIHMIVIVPLAPLIMGPLIMLVDPATTMKRPKSIHQIPMISLTPTLNRISRPQGVAAKISRTSVRSICVEQPQRLKENISAPTLSVVNSMAQRAV